MQNTILKNLVLGLCCCLPFLASAQNTGLLGKWIIQYPDGSGGSIPVQLTLKEDGTYTFDAGLDGATEVEGKYTVEGDQITLEDTGGSYACVGKKGVYKFTIVENTNTLTRVSDPCEIRGTEANGTLVFTRPK